jgi:hypothetical protein
VNGMLAVLCWSTVGRTCSMGEREGVETSVWSAGPDHTLFAFGTSGKLPVSQNMMPMSTPMYLLFNALWTSCSLSRG